MAWSVVASHRRTSTAWPVVSAPDGRQRAMKLSASGTPISCPDTRVRIAPSGVPHVPLVMADATEPPSWSGIDAATATLPGRMMVWFGSAVMGTDGRGAGGR